MKTVRTEAFPEERASRSASECPFRFANPARSGIANDPTGASMPTEISRTTKLVPTLVLAVSLAVTGQLWKNESDNARFDAEREFETHKEEAKRLIGSRLSDYGHVLRWARSLFAGGMERRTELKNFVRDLDIENKYPGLLGISFAPLLSKDELPGHLRKLRSEGFSEYAVRPEWTRDAYVPVTYIEPHSGNNLRAMGHDPYSDPKRRAVMEGARDADRVGITDSLRLVQTGASEAVPGFLMYMPVYRNGAPYSNAEERRKSIAGWLAAPILVRGFVSDLETASISGVLHVRIHDGRSTSEESLMYDSNSHPDAPHGSAPLFSSVDELEAFGHTWTVVTHATPKFESKMAGGKSLIIAASGIAASLLLSLLAWFLVYGRKMAIEAARKMNAELIESETKLRAIIDGNMDSFVQIDSKGVIVAWGGGAEKTLGWSAEEAVGTDIADLIIPERYRKAHKNGMASLGREEDCPEVCDSVREVSVLRKDGTEFPVEFAVTRIEWGGNVEYCAFLHDITERKRQAKTILEMATHDPLTGLPNRNLLSDRLEQAIHASEREDEHCGVLFVDLDYFKPVNDTFGHAVGDELLVQVAQRLSSAVRSIDTVARFWGDEFVIVAPGLKDVDDVSRIAMKAIAVLSEPFRIFHHEIRIGASVGVSVFPRDGADAASLLHKSDAAMYRAKGSGRGTFQ